VPEHVDPAADDPPAEVDGRAQPVTGWGRLAGCHGNLLGKAESVWRALGAGRCFSKPLRPAGEYGPADVTCRGSAVRGGRENRATRAWSAASASLAWLLPGPAAVTCVSGRISLPRLSFMPPGLMLAGWSGKAVRLPRAWIS